MENSVKWRRLDNTAKIFPMIASENLSNVFRISATLRRPVNQELLQLVLEEVLPLRKDFQVKLRRGVFWYYFEENPRIPKVSRESAYPCSYIDPHGNQKFLFRVTYFESRINLEVFHGLTDGLGAISFLKQLVYRYLQMEMNHWEAGIEPEEGKEMTVYQQGFSLPQDVEDSYLKHYKESRKRGYSSGTAYRLSGNYLPWGSSQLIHGYLNLAQVKAACKRYGVSITKYLVAVYIWSIQQERPAGGFGGDPVVINLPINLRSFFPSETTANFFAVTMIGYLTKNPEAGFKDILRVVGSQMDKKIVKERLEENISYNVSNEKKWYIRITPLFLKAFALKIVFYLKSRAYTATLSNLGPLSVEEAYKDEIVRFHAMIGVSRRQPMKCCVISYGNEIVVTMASAFGDHNLQKRFFNRIKSDGVLVRIEGNDVSGVKTQNAYPRMHRILVFRKGGREKAGRMVRKVESEGVNAARGLLGYANGSRDLFQELKRRFHL